MKSTIILFVFLAAAVGTKADLKDGLITHWSFDKDNGTRIVDESGHRLHGESIGITYSSGPIGQSVKFDNRADRIYIPNANDTTPELVGSLTHGSISVWFKYKSIGGQVLPILYFGEDDSTKKHNSLIIEIGHQQGNPANRRLYFTIINTRFCYDSGYNLEEDKWYHFVAVVSETGNTGYLNGKEMTRRHYNLGSDSAYSDFFADVPIKDLLTIGYGRYGQENGFFTFNGSIDDVRIYNRPLSQTEVSELWAMGDTSGADLNEPSFENVAYGPDVRNVLDFWQAESFEPTPVVFYIHGGGFIGGSKNTLRTGRNLEYLQEFLEAGVSVAAISYRFRNTTRLDTIMMDCARAVQFVRSKAKEWNIDKNRVGSFGGSAGGGATIWLGYHDDIADMNNPDPVLRESSKIQVCGHLNSQATYDIAQWEEILGLDSTWFDDFNYNDDLDIYHITDRSQYDNPDIVALRKYLDMTGHLDKDDPPTFFQCLLPNTEPTNINTIHHHPRHPIYVKSKLDELGIDNEIHLLDTPPQEVPDMVDFFLKHLMKPSDIEFNDDITISVFPNPANNYIEINIPPLERGSGGVSVFDVLGTIVLNEKIHPMTSSHRMNIDSLSPGVYFLRVGGRMYRFVKT